MRVDLILLILFINNFLLTSFRKWLGPKGLLVTSVCNFILISIVVSFNIILILKFGCYWYIDFGRWFFFFNLIDSNFLFCFDLLALTLILLVSILTPLALIFGSEYMYREVFISRLLILLNLFATSVILLFISYDFFLIILAWEGIGLFSLLLVNFYSTRVFTIKAALKTFIFSRISDTFLFLSLIIFLLFFQTLDLSLIFLQTPFFAFHYIFVGSYAFHLITSAAFCLVTSGLIKSAQFFFHVWLPDAMEAPTPASALIHSSTLVIAGIFLILRFALFLDFAPAIFSYLSLIGSFTLAFASITATFQRDIKKLVAYSTISQIGYLVCGCGFAIYNEVLIYLIIHALNKAFLFILVGYLVHFFNGNTDLRYMGGAWIFGFDLSVLLLGLVFNLIGLPYSAGYISKEFLLLQFFKNDTFSIFIQSCWLISLIFSPIYMSLLIVKVLYGPLKLTKNLFLKSYDFIKFINFYKFRVSLFFYNSKSILFSPVTMLIFFLFFWFIWFLPSFFFTFLFEWNSLTTALFNSNFFSYSFNSLNSIYFIPYNLINFISLFVYNIFFFLLWFWLFKNWYQMYFSSFFLILFVIF